MAVVQISREMSPNDKHQCAFFSREELVDAPEGPCERGEEGIQSTMLQDVLLIRGICHARITPYCIVVCKSPMWDWSEINPHMLRILAAFNTPLPETATNQGEEV